VRKKNWKTEMMVYWTLLAMVNVTEMKLEAALLAQEYRGE
jgi:hypothetical protein